MTDNSFTIEELSEVIEAQKNDRAPGPEWLRAELVQWFLTVSRNSISMFYDGMIQTGHFPETFEKIDMG